MKKIFRSISLIIAVLFGIQSAIPQSLKPDEMSIVDHIDRNAARSEALLEESVNIQSPTEDLAGVKRAGMMMAREFESIGMSARWIELPPETKRAGHLIAETHGTRGKRLLLLGHLDTVLTGEKFRREGDRAFGTGIADMKGGNIIMLEALRALHQVGKLKDTRITVILTGDEENSCEPVSVCRGAMIDAARRSDAVLSFEGSIRGTATVGRRGSSSWTIEVEARTGHSSGIFRESMGYGAIFEAARIISEFREKLGGEKYLTFNPSLFVGGTTAAVSDAEGSASGKTNVVPARVVVKGDLRFISEEQKESARSRMREIVARNLPGAKAAISFEDGIPAMTPVDGNYALLKQLDQASRDLGFGPVEALDPGDRGAGDIAFVADLLPGLDGIGIGGGQNSHAKGESADIASLPRLTKRAAILIYRLTRSPE